MKAERAVRDYVESLEAVDVETRGKLSLAYLDSPLVGTTDYLTLDDGMQENVVRITEKDRAAVSDFKVVNESEKKILLLMGEQLRGEKQNRTINTTILVGAKQEVIIPVSCTEQGRWAYNGKQVKSEAFLHGRVRADLAYDVSDTLRAAGTYTGRQERVWTNIAEANSRFGVDSRTGAVDEIYSEYESEVDEIFRQFRRGPRGIGILGSTADLMCADAFAQRATISRIWEKLIKSYIVDSLSCSKAAPVTDTDAKKFLGKVGEADLSVFDSPGLGQTVRIADENFSGSCLVNDGEVIHLSLFSNRLRGRRRDNFATLASPGERYGL